MTDDIVTRLENLADHYKNGNNEMLYADYETVCDAWREIENLREDSGRWKRLFIELYPKNDGVTDEMMWAYRKETGKC